MENYKIILEKLRANKEGVSQEMVYVNLESTVAYLRGKGYSIHTVSRYPDGKRGGTYYVLDEQPIAKKGWFGRFKHWRFGAR